MNPMKKLILTTLLLPAISMAQVDLSIDSTFHRVGSGINSLGFDYYVTPQAFDNDSIRFAAYVSNNGGSDATNVQLQIEIFNAGSSLTTLSSTPVSLCAGCQDSIAATTSYTPNLAGNYDFVYTVISDSIDSFQSDNVDSLDYLLSVGTYYWPYRRDNGVISDSMRK